MSSVLYLTVLSLMLRSSDLQNRDVIHLIQNYLSFQITRILSHWWNPDNKAFQVFCIALWSPEPDIWAERTESIATFVSEKIIEDMNCLEGIGAELIATLNDRM